MTSRSLFLAALTALLLTSCFCPQHYYPSVNPPELPPYPPVSKPVRLALVLGGGGAKGLAHVGVLEELEAAHIPIDLIVGCSAGSIVGALYADDPSTEDLKSTLLGLNSNILIDFDLWHARYGLCQGRSLRRFLQTNLDAECFDELKIPFFVVATDLYSAELITIGGGPIIPAVEASCAIPLVFVPVALHGRVFVDGGVIDPVPVQVARQFDPEIIVAVDLGSLLPQALPSNLFEVASRSAEIALLWQSERCVRHAHVVIRPELCGIGTFDHEFNEQIYQAGRRAAREALPQIIACLLEKGCLKDYSPEPLSKPGASPSFLPY